MSIERKIAQDWLVGYISQVIDIAPEAIALDKPFNELGIDSAELVIMTGVMEEEFAVQIQAELPFQHPTVAGFLDALQERDLVAA